MSSEPLYEEVYVVEGKDFVSAGSVSIAIRRALLRKGLDPATIRRVAIVSYEAEMNIVLYALRGEIRLKIFPQEVRLEAEDHGPGIADINLALKDGYSTATPEIRELGFGAGMGLPNIKRNVDEFSISSTLGEGTKLFTAIRPKGALPR
jgi:anti-sigma regulatory factor (Ser/Thr protein kinase)